MSQLTPRPKRKASVSMSPLANTTKYQRSTTPVKIDPTKLRNLEPELSRINHDRLEEFCKLLCSAASGDTNIALVQALIDNSYLDKNLMITDEEENVKTYLITAYWESEKTSNGMNQPVETPPIDLGSQHPLEDLEDKELCDNLKENMRITEKALKDIKKANETNSIRISQNENSITRKDFEREERSLLLSKIEIDKTIINSWKAATNAKETLLKSWYEANKEEADKQVGTLKELSESKFIKMINIIESSTFNSLAKKPKLDTTLNYFTIPIQITFTSASAKDFFRSNCAKLGIGARDGSPKLFKSQKDDVTKYYNELSGNQAQSKWVKLDVRLGREDDPVMYTIQTKTAKSVEKWITQARVKVLPPNRWGRLSGSQRKEHVNKAMQQMSK